MQGWGSSTVGFRLVLGGTLQVSDFLQMRGPPEPHHVLKEKGLLHEWRAGRCASVQRVQCI